MTWTEAGLLLTALESVLSMRPEQVIETLERFPTARLWGRLDSELSHSFDSLRALAAAVDEESARRSEQGDRDREDQEAEYQRLAWPEEPTREDLA